MNGRIEPMITNIIQVEGWKCRGQNHKATKIIYDTIVFHNESLDNGFWEVFRPEQDWVFDPILWNRFSQFDRVQLELVLDLVGPILRFLDP